MPEITLYGKNQQTVMLRVTLGQACLDAAKIAAAFFVT